MEEHKNFPAFWEAVLILALLFGIQVVAGIFMYDMGYGFEAGDPFASALITVISCGIVFSVLMSYRKTGYRKLFNQSQNSVKSIVVVLFVPIALTVLGGVVWITSVTNLLLYYFPADEREQLAITRMLSGGVVSVLFVCVIAPILEEMLFRGIILRGFLQNYSPWRSIFLSSLLFALYHMTISQIPVAFITGCFLGWLYVKTKSLWPSIMAHFFYNSLVMMIVYAFSSPGEDPAWIAEFDVGAVVLFAFALSATGILMLFYLFKTSVQKVQVDD